MATTPTTEAGGGAHLYKLTQWGAWWAIVHWRKSCLRGGRTTASFFLVFPQWAQPCFQACTAACFYFTIQACFWYFTNKT